jgi:exodeoxyribonuclease I
LSQQSDLRDGVAGSESMFVFYDTETTGTNVAFDQILQFAAMLTDDRLREVARFQIRCQLLPWVVPSPGALLVTDSRPEDLADPSLPTFFEMMKAIRAQIEKWSPAYFIGYNSMRFDEPLLQRAFWQSLNPPYVTVTNGNARLDLLPLVRAVAHFMPDALMWPTRADGSNSFKLDQIAPKNGFSSQSLHDAMTDVEATVYIAQALVKHAPTLWAKLVSRAPKKETASVLSFGRPVLIFEHVARKPKVWFGQRVDQDGVRTSEAIVACLEHEWSSSEKVSSSASAKSDALGQTHLRRIALNKAPVLLTIEEAHELFRIKCSSELKVQSEFLAANREYCEQLASSKRAGVSYSVEGGELEESIFKGFPTKADEVLMEKFQESDWPKRAEIARAFGDNRMRSLAFRLIYVSAPHLLSKAELGRIRSGIAKRVAADETEPHSWRSVPDALRELSETTAATNTDERVVEIEEWLRKVGSKSLA